MKFSKSISRTQCIIFLIYYLNIYLFTDKLWRNYVTFFAIAQTQTDDLLIMYSRQSTLNFHSTTEEIHFF